MAGVDSYLLLVAVVLGVNVLPAFGPPTWSVLVLFRLNSHVPAVPLVVLGALSAATGRLLLASLSARFADRVSDRRRRSLQAVRVKLLASRRRALAGLALFALSPVPSAQLFVAAGLLRLRLLPLTLAFFAGRLVSYSIYVGAASAARASLGDVVRRSLTSWPGLLAEAAMIAALVLLFRVDWAERIARRGVTPRGPGSAPA